jgi:hypothetical protein
MIWRDTFPWRSHRTLAEVAETERLREKRRTDDSWHNGNAVRLAALEARACEPPALPVA